MRLSNEQYHRLKLRMIESLHYIDKYCSKDSKEFPDYMSPDAIREEAIERYQRDPWFYRYAYFIFHNVTNFLEEDNKEIKHGSD